MISFGVCVPQDGLSYQAIKQVALRSEELGFDAIWLFDHLHSFPKPDREPLLECWTTLSALAESTRRIRLGSLVTNAQYRNPALLAKMAATVDNISDGRLEFGVGAGGTGRAEWAMRLSFNPEYRAYGMDFSDALRTRIRRLEEALQIVKKLWSEDKATFTGKYYQIEDAFCYPKPIQKPHPPIWVGGAGEKHTLRVVARLADGCNFAWSLSPEDCQKKLNVLSEHCKTLGRDESSIRKSFLTACVLGKTSDDVRRTLQHISDEYHGIPGYLPYALRKATITGTADDCIRRINDYNEVGVNYFMLAFPQREMQSSLGEFAKNVMASF